MDGIALLGHFYFLAGFPGLCRGIRGKFPVPHTAAISAEPPRLLHYRIGVWIRRFLCARVGRLAAGDDCGSHGSQAWSAARDVTDCCSVYVAQWNDREAHRLLAGAFARAPPDPGTFSRPVYSLDGFVELRFAPDAAVRCVGAAGLPARAAVFWMVPAFACQPRPGPDRTSRASGVSIEFRGPSAVCTLVQRFLVAPVCRAIPRGRT